MARFRLLSLLVGIATLTSTASGAPTGLLDNVVGTVVGAVTGTVNTTVNTLVKTVASVVDTTRVVIVLKSDVKSVIDGVADYSTDIWTEQKRIDNINNIVNALRQYAQQTQGPVINLLSGLLYQAYWINNVITVKNCPLSVIQQLVALPIVEEIIYDVVFDIFPVQPAAASPGDTANAGWGATKIQATNVWTASNTGQNVVVATIDSGVRSTHEVLVNNWVGANGWYDPDLKTATPYDANGHGTHTMATIAGGSGVGIAPSVKWLTCMGCGAASCKLSLLLSCAQFILCPTDTNGNNCNPAKAPHIVSNSWGSGQGMTYFQSSIDAWYAARIIPVFAAGNNGANGCGSVVSPGDSAKVFSVGASDGNDALGSFSSLGPSLNGLVKPDFAGPGVSVRSAWNGNNADYRSVSGTSMAAPHVAGTIALALSARPGLCFANLQTILSGATDRSTLPATAQTCGGTSSSTFPNNQYGNGRINAQKAVNAALAF
ncbi:Suppressor of the cold-sensitive snRNP biogenesis mutant brr1-1 [Phytophthora boehmeriae]|uniref:Suppressor of the cold-sensitive snRNP biogenesis mutant brr1-1 n=1 Tax=Phytophthora boehmeriae TaxID=109152 RepID=A0A8T1W6S5_9STRA|nr:Suppressor of the cold-sensitive snRNP biogenesis mutant brr1-1 [Phytophthora boehmeriae]